MNADSKKTYKPKTKQPWGGFGCLASGAKHVSPESITFFLKLFLPEPYPPLAEKTRLRVRKKQLYNLSRLDLVDLIGLDRKRSLSYTEDSAREDWTKMA